MRSRLTGTGWATVVAAVALLAGCTSEGSPAASGASAPAGVAPVGARPVPVDDGALGPAATALLARRGAYFTDEHTLQQAEARLAARCMTGRGFAERPDADPAGEEDETWLPNLDLRRRVGYRIGPSQTGEGSVAAESGPAAPAGYQLALLGPDTQRGEISLPGGSSVTFATSGCLPQARQALYGSVENSAKVSAVLQVVYLNLYAAAEARPEFAAVQRRWAECMHGKGIVVETFDDARSLAADGYVGGALAGQRREVEIAVSDGACAVAVNAPATMSAVVLDLARDLPAPVRSAYDEAARLRADALTRAVALPTH